MKLKAIEKVPPIILSGTGKHIAAQEKDGILILDVSKDGVHAGRQAINHSTGEYMQIDLLVCEKPTWKKRKFFTLLGFPEPYWYYSMKQIRESTKFEEGSEKLIRAFLKPMEWKGTLEAIDDLEKEHRREMSWNYENNRITRVNELMNTVPELPEDFEHWATMKVAPEQMTFKGKEGWKCSACDNVISEEIFCEENHIKKITHNKILKCPLCGSSITAKTRNKRVETWGKVMIIQEMTDEYGVCRHFDVKTVWDECGKDVSFREAVRVVMEKKPAFVKKGKYWPCSIFYSQYTRNSYYSTHYNSFDNKGNPAGRHIDKAYLYPKGAKEGLEGTAYDMWGELFSQFARIGALMDYNQLMCGYREKNLPGLTEMLYKGRFYKLLNECADSVSVYNGAYAGPLKLSETTIEGVFGLSDRQKINRIRDKNGGKLMLKWMKWCEMRPKTKLPDKALDFFLRENLEPDDLKWSLLKMSPEAIANYISRQRKESYPAFKITSVVNQYEDYMDIAELLGKDTSDEMVYRPRELKRRHDEAVKEYNIHREALELKRDEARRKEKAKEYEERFPKAVENLQKVRDKFSWETEGYEIKVPEKLYDIVTEGQALHHCAGATDRYFDRISRNETYICFLRKTEDPESAYYTIEVEPGGTIRQHRGMYDEEPDIEEVKPILRKWQQVIRKRMTKEDFTLAKQSEKLREENIEDLKAKNNTRVLKGLAEDFMEAI